MAARALEGVRTLQQRTSLIVDPFHPHAIPALDEADPEADTASDNDAESVSVAVPQQPTPAQQEAPRSQCLRRATTVLAGSVPFIAGMAMMLEGHRREAPALVTIGATTLVTAGGQLVAAGLNQILDYVVARCCDAEPEAGQAAV